MLSVHFKFSNCASFVIIELLYKDAKENPKTKQQHDISIIYQPSAHLLPKCLHRPLKKTHDR